MIRLIKRKYRIALIILASLLISLHGFSAQNNTTKLGQSINSTPEISTGFIPKIAKSIIDFADDFKGTRYRLGASGPNRFDCSGFTKYVFSKFGFDLTRSSKNQYQEGDAVKKSSLKPGDLVFFSGRKVSKNVGHVGIVVSADENGGFDFIHASNSGVKISSSDESYYNRRYIGARRVLQGSNPDVVSLQKDISADITKFSPVKSSKFTGSLTDLPKLK